jgi:hypothetical protein
MNDFQRIMRHSERVVKSRRSAEPSPAWYFYRCYSFAVTYYYSLISVVILLSCSSHINLDIIQISYLFPSIIHEESSTFVCVSASAAPLENFNIGSLPLSTCSRILRHSKNISIQPLFYFNGVYIDEEPGDENISIQLLFDL